MSCTCHVPGITPFILISLSITTEYYSWNWDGKPCHTAAALTSVHQACWMWREHVWLSFFLVVEVQLAQVQGKTTNKSMFLGAALRQWWWGCCDWLVQIPSSSVGTVSCHALHSYPAFPSGTGLSSPIMVSSLIIFPSPPCLRSPPK